MEEKLKLKSQKCDSLSHKLAELENEASNSENIQAQLVDNVT